MFYRDLAVWVGVVLRSSHWHFNFRFRRQFYDCSGLTASLEVCCVFIGGETPDPLSKHGRKHTYMGYRECFLHDISNLRHTRVTYLAFSSEFLM
jgi:hypothetical protein